MKLTAIASLIFSLASSAAFAAGTIKVYTPESAEPKTLTDAAHLIDLVGQPRLANSWWPGAVISEQHATQRETQRHQALLARLAALAADEEGDDAAAINALRQQLQGPARCEPAAGGRVQPVARRAAFYGYRAGIGEQPWQKAVHTGTRRRGIFR